MKAKAHLFKVGYCTYSVNHSNKSIAKEYLRRILGSTIHKIEYIGKDTMTEKQQWESTIIGVAVPKNWKPNL